MKSVIFTRHDLQAAYACLFYLQQELSKEMETHIWGFTTIDKIQKNNKNNYHGFQDLWYGNTKRLKAYLMKLTVLLEARKYNIIIINDLDFYSIGYIIKKLYPQKKVIHYNTEIYGADIKASWHSELFYKNHANYPDLIIECLKERAIYRKNKYGINKEIYVINNTLPLAQIDIEIVEVNEYFTFEDELPIAIYAGGCNLTRNLNDIISCIPKFEKQLNFMFFCHGDEKDFKNLESECKKYHNCRIFHVVERKILFNIMSKCDIGIQYYDPKISINNKYASPSKLFEYMALGLNIVSSNNEGINHIIEDNNLGVCIMSEDTMEDGFKKLLKKGLTPKSEIKQVFLEKYCYEKDSQTAIRKIKEFII